MSQPYVGEIRQFAGNFAPAGWAFCDGQLMPISENETLFNLIGTTYGGDGQSTFAAPGLNGRVPMHMGTLNGTTYQIGETGGAEAVTLTTAQIPNHTHNALGASVGTADRGDGNVWAESKGAKPYVAGPATTLMNANAIGASGGSQPHDNMIPFVGLNYIISLFGTFPSPSGGNGIPFLAQINIFSFNFAPGGWAMCNGQFLPINQNQALFSLLGTTFGGNGQTTFALPNLQGRIVMDDGTGFSGSMVLGEVAGEVSHTLNSGELAAHSHAPNAGSRPDVNTPAANYWASGTGFTPFAAIPDGQMATGTMSSVGGSQAHNNMSPFLVLNFCIALTGIFPSRN